MDDHQSAKTAAERRRYPRIEAQNDVSYILFNAGREITDQGRGKILNLSQGGTLLETEKPLDGAYVILAVLDPAGNKVKVPGRLANARQSEKTGGYQTGIEFRGSREQKIRAIVAFVKGSSRRDNPARKNRLYAVKSLGERFK
ncbi:MAG: PilZ domain-containing protein [Desulfobacteraceae bacterium]|nr:PilZ domain-containing protein [Desulfobacteraceae bacterium]